MGLFWYWLMSSIITLCVFVVDDKKSRKYISPATFASYVVTSAGIGVIMAPILLLFMAGICVMFVYDKAKG